MAKKKNPKSKQKSNKILLIAIGIVVAILAVAFAVYAIMSPTPEERVAAGLMKLVTSDTVSVESQSTSLRDDGSNQTTMLKAITNKQVVDAELSLRIESEDQDTFDTTVAAVVPEDGDLYVKIDDPKTTLKEGVDALLGVQTGQAGSQQGAPSNSLRDMLAPYIEDVADTIGDKWVRVPNDELAINTYQEKVSAGCYVDFVRETQSNKEARTQLISLFEKHNFIRIDDTLERKGTSAGYRVSIDQEVLETFLENAGGNAAFDKIAACDPTLRLLVGTEDQQVDMWVDRFSNSITHVELGGAGTSDATTEVKFGYSGRVNVNTPADSVDLSEVIAPLGAMQPEISTEVPTPEQ